jgi:Zn-dependent protease with chaperone function
MNPANLQHLHKHRNHTILPIDSLSAVTLRLHKHIREETMTNHRKIRSLAAFGLSVMLTLTPMLATAQTRISLDKNKYSVQDDVKVGRDAAAQVERQMPVLDDRQVQAYVARVGENLVSAIPAQFRQPAFDYTFKVINASDINAFALPGGPMYVNRGMIQAARNEGEMAGVMAHEISHVALRHATAQATKTQKYQIGSILGQIAGAVIGGGVGQVIGAGSQIGFGIGALKYSREYETQADILGSQIMANAGYDPRDLANMFQTIARQGGGRTPEFLSSHPDPGNRYQKINQEAARLNVSSNPIKVTQDFARIQERLSGMPGARSMAEIGRDGSSGSNNPMAGGQYSGTVPAPSTRMRTYNGNGISINVPSNWREFSQGSLIFAPDGAYGDQGITHGVMIGAYRPQSSGLANASRDYVNTMLQSNSYLTQRSGLTRATVGGRQGYTTTLSGRSPVNGQNERVTIFTTQLRSGDLLFIAAVAPESESYRYNSAFRNMVNSIRLSD